jgi:(p)ppGpp synthase/HD superfamily hydrolase
MSLSIIFKAMQAAELAHRGQLRKYSGEPYIVHPIAVAKLLAKEVGDLEVIAAAILHDTLEDTDLSEDAIKAEFGPRVLALVKEVSKVSLPTDGNRAVRKALDQAHYAAASPDGKSIKLADLADNLKSVGAEDASFAKVFFKEAAVLLPKLAAGSPGLYGLVEGILADYERSVK